MSDKKDGSNGMSNAEILKMAKEANNSVIIEKFVSYLLSNDLSMKDLPKMMLKTGGALAFKELIDNGSKYIDNMKFTDASFVKYYIQYLKYGEESFIIRRISSDKKWCSGENNFISQDTLKPFLEGKGIYADRPGTYYMYYRFYLIKVKITNDMIEFCIPKIGVVNDFIKIDILTKHREHTHGSMTKVYKLQLTTADSTVFKPEQIRPTDAFSTKNYQQLETILKNSQTYNELAKSPTTPLAINFDGKPGTGKTSFASYISARGVFHRIFLVNLVQSRSLKFLEMIRAMERTIETTKDKTFEGEEQVLVVFDEVDKYLDSATEHEINKKREEARVTKESVDKDGKPVATTKAEKMTEQEEIDLRLTLKCDFMDDLYKLVDGHVLSDNRRYVLIFNTNHFERMFSFNGKKEVAAKYEALRSRFTRFEFNEVGRLEIGYWMDSICETIRMRAAQRKEPLNDDFDMQAISSYDHALLAAVPKDFMISYRNLFKVLRNNAYNLNQTLRFVATSATAGAGFDRFNIGSSSSAPVKDEVETKEYDVRGVAIEKSTSPSTSSSSGKPEEVNPTVV
jgi:hypothetical protein